MAIWFGLLSGEQHAMTWRMSMTIRTESPPTKCPLVDCDDAVAGHAANPPESAWWVLAPVGRRGLKNPGEAAVMAVCVSESYPTGSEARIALLNQISALARPKGMPVVYLLPAGFFGFDAKRFYEQKRHKKDLGLAWLGLSAASLEALKGQLYQEILGWFGAQATLVVGIDCGPCAEEQFAWIGQTDVNGIPTRSYLVQRSQTSLGKRKVPIGNNITAAVFVCGEFSGSYGEKNGPFCVDSGVSEYLAGLDGRLDGIDLVVDVAHSRVPMMTPSPCKLAFRGRYLFQNQMDQLASLGIACALAHHHAGEQHSDGSPKSHHHSGWVVGASRKWIPKNTAQPICLLMTANHLQTEDSHRRS